MRGEGGGGRRSEGWEGEVRGFRTGKWRVDALCKKLPKLGRLRKRSGEGRRGGGVGGQGAVGGEFIQNLPRDQLDL